MTIFINHTSCTKGDYSNKFLLFNLAKKTNDEGEYFPLWGTGLGFEAIIELIN